MLVPPSIPCFPAATAMPWRSRPCLMYYLLLLLRITASVRFCCCCSRSSPLGVGQHVSLLNLESVILNHLYSCSNRTFTFQLLD